jgi:hypothetical protein
MRLVGTIVTLVVAAAMLTYVAYEWAYSKSAFWVILGIVAVYVIPMTAGIIIVYLWTNDEDSS